MWLNTNRFGTDKGIVPLTLARFCTVKQTGGSVLSTLTHEPSESFSLSYYLLPAACACTFLASQLSLFIYILKSYMCFFYCCISGYISIIDSLCPCQNRLNKIRNVSIYFLVIEMDSLFASAAVITAGVCGGTVLACYAYSKWSAKVALISNTILNIYKN